MSAELLINSVRSDFAHRMLIRSRAPNARSTAVVCLAVVCTAAAAAAAAAGQHDSTATDSGFVLIGSEAVLPALAVGTGGAGSGGAFDEATAEEAVQAALSVGVRAVDTAWAYHNQAGVGRAARASGVAPFVISKVPGCGDVATGHVDRSRCEGDTYDRIMDDVHDLDLGRPIDLLLIHTPPDPPPGELDPCAPSNCAVIQAQWRGAERAYRAGVVRALGVAQYCPACYECLLRNATVPPAVNQLEYFAGLGPDPQGLRSYFQSNGVVVQAFSPLGAGFPPALRTAPTLRRIAAASHRTVAQVLLRWVHQRHVAVLSKSVNRAHLRQDVAALDPTWALNAEAMRAIDRLHATIDLQGRYAPSLTPWWFGAVRSLRCLARGDVRLEAAVRAARGRLSAVDEQLVAAGSELIALRRARTVHRATPSATTKGSDAAAAATMNSTDADATPTAATAAMHLGESSASLRSMWAASPREAATLARLVKLHTDRDALAESLLQRHELSSKARQLSLAKHPQGLSAT